MLRLLRVRALIRMPLVDGIEHSRWHQSGGVTRGSFVLAIDISKSCVRESYRGGKKERKEKKEESISKT